MTFGPYMGMYHCLILEHEGMTTMGNYNDHGSHDVNVVGVGGHRPTQIYRYSVGGAF